MKKVSIVSVIIVLFLCVVVSVLSGNCGYALSFGTLGAIFTAAILLLTKKQKLATVPLIVRKRREA